MTTHTSAETLAAETYNTLVARGDARKAADFADVVGYDPTTGRATALVRRGESFSRAFLRTS